MYRTPSCFSRTVDTTPEPPGSFHDLLTGGPADPPGGPPRDPSRDPTPPASPGPPERSPAEEDNVATDVRERLKRPSLYRVILLNDDYTPMDFVVHVLQRFFQKTVDEATEVMLRVHRTGVGVCGVYTYEIAETKVLQVMESARRQSHPLQCRLEEE